MIAFASPTIDRRMDRLEASLDKVMSERQPPSVVAEISVHLHRAVHEAMRLVEQNADRLDAPGRDTAIAVRSMTAAAHLARAHRLADLWARWISWCDRTLDGAKPSTSLAEAAE